MHSQSPAPAAARRTHRLELEMWLSRGGILITLVASALSVTDLATQIMRGADQGGVLGQADAIMFAAVVVFLIYGALVYQVARLGHLRRSRTHEVATDDDLACHFDVEAAPLAVLVPSYREEERTIRQTLLSAALQQYASRRVVLLIDDPPEPGDRGAREALERARAIPSQLHQSLRAPAKACSDAAATVEALLDSSRTSAAVEQLAAGFEVAAGWLEASADAHDRCDHTDELFIQRILLEPAARHRAFAGELRRSARGPIVLDHQRLREHTRRLTCLFDVELSSFERKRYENLSHAPNKAMNLNSYLGLMGGTYRVEERPDGKHVVASCRHKASLFVPDAEFVVTLDADSLLEGDYVPRLVDHLSRPGNERVAVVQTPYSAVPGARAAIERIAGATTDIQFIIHQGFGRHGATYWVGANALIRMAALRDIAETDVERGHRITRFVQDRTVIEDTESTIDLIARGWTLDNYPARLSYSASPADFGALVIQRRRWANGGLIILPKLLRYLLRMPRGWRTAGEAFMRIHYLTSIAATNLGLLLLLAVPPGPEMLSWWLPLTALPYFALQARDLSQSGYRAADIARVYGLNLLLVPVNLGGVAKSLSQALTRQKIPFRRTPKVDGRTVPPVGCLLAVYAILAHWTAGAVFDVTGGRLLHAAFGAGNAALLAAAISWFIGHRVAVADVSSAVRLVLRSALRRARKPIAGGRRTAAA